MRISNKAIQETFIVNTYFYTGEEIKEMEQSALIENLYGSYYIIRARNIISIRVVLDKNGCYRTVAATKDLRQIYINL